MKLEARDISFRYTAGGRQVLSHVNLTVESGERVGLTAPSGAGKTTLLKILAGYEKPAEGEILLDGKALNLYKGYCPVQMVWQHPELSVNPRQKLKTVLDEGDWGDSHGSGHAREHARKPSGPAAERLRIEQALGILDEWKDRYPVEVSGGELQRFCIARALGRRTEILLADEITTMLDLITQSQIWSFLLAETKQRGLSMVAVSHSPDLLARVCDRIVTL